MRDESGQDRLAGQLHRRGRALRHHAGHRPLGDRERVALAGVGGGRAREAGACARSTCRARAWATTSSCRSSSTSSIAAASTPRKICFEITETAAVASFSQANRFIQALKELGCRSRSTTSAPACRRSATSSTSRSTSSRSTAASCKEILHDPIDREMVRSINEIGHLTGKQTIAEFAENAGDHPDAAQRWASTTRRATAYRNAAARAESCALPDSSRYTRLTESHRQVDGAGRASSERRPR